MTMTLRLLGTAVVIGLVVWSFGSADRSALASSTPLTGPSTMRSTSRPSAS